MTGPDQVRRRARVGVALLLLGAYGLLTGVAAANKSAAPPVEKLSGGLQINPNTATAEELQLLPGIGPKIAANIIAFRESASRVPAFAGVADMQDVPRIGPVTADRIAPYLWFDEPAAER